MLHVFEDADASTAPAIHHDVESALLHALGPLADVSHRQNLQLNPSSTHDFFDAENTIPTKPGSSPCKRHSSPLQPIASSEQPLLGCRLSPPSPPNFNTDSPSKNPRFYAMYQNPHSNIGHPLYAHPQNPPMLQYDKENFPQHTLEGQGAFGPVAPFSAPAPWHAPMPTTAPTTHQPHLKRSLPDASASAAPARPSAPKKARTSAPKAEDEQQQLPQLPQHQPQTVELPDPLEMPPVVDDGSKPAHSYAELIGMAILRAPNRRLTLAQIYKWISDNFAFYKSTEGGWQNSIRHNLSLNKNFIKQERPKDDPGKGNYWAIKPGEERPFLLGRKNPVRKIMHPDGSQYIHGLQDMSAFRPSTMSTPAIGHFILAPNPVKRATPADPPRPRSSRSVQHQQDTADLLSSDGTIPASDPALNEADRDEADAAAMPPPPLHMRSSPPPPADLGSSPPTLRSVRKASIATTPPPPLRFPQSSRSHGRRRKFASMNDSGYWSSIESSAARGAAHQLMTSEADLRGHRIKKGRAEAEIARIRSSSFDSPNNSRRDAVAEVRSTLLSVPHALDSSPIRHEPHEEENPLTPAVVFMRPTRPPPSVSPNTNLRNHRDRVKALLGSPVKSLSPTVDADVWSPAFTLGEEAAGGFLTPYGISPCKPSTKTPWRMLMEGPTASAAAAASAAPTSAYNFSQSEFDIFIDAPGDDLIARGSPEKRPASGNRASMARAASSTSILADITGSAKSNSSLLAPPPMLNPFVSAALSPLAAKHSTLLHSPMKMGSPLKQVQGATPTLRAGTPSSGIKRKSLSADLGNIGPSPHVPSQKKRKLFPPTSPSPSPATASRVLAANHSTVVTGDIFNPHPKSATKTNVAADQLIYSDASEEAIDIFQDFGKIGHHVAAKSNSLSVAPSFHQHAQHAHPMPGRATGNPVRRSSITAAATPRPGMVRSESNRW